MLTYMSWSQMCAGRFDEAICNSNCAVAEARRIAQVYTLAHALTGAAFVALTIVSPRAGLERLNELYAALTDSGIAYYNAVETIFRGWCLAAIGEHTDALTSLVRGMSAYRATDSVLYLPGFLRMSAEAHGWAGRIDVAMRLLGEAFEVMQATDQRWDEAEMHRVHGALLRRAGDEAAAVQAFRRACAVAVKQGARLWELRARCDLLEGRGAATDAATDAVGPLRSLVASFDDKSDAPELHRARAILQANPEVLATSRGFDR
jgi:predicted ATPase